MAEFNLKALIRVFRRECHRVLDSERVAIHGTDSMLLVLQLAAAEVNKQERGEFCVALSDVLETWKCLLLDKLHLSPDASPLPKNYELIQKEYNGFLKRTNTVDLIDVYNMYKELKQDEDPEDPLTATQLFEFLLGGTDDAEEAETIPQFPATPSNRVRTCNVQVQRAIRRLFCSYLGMLVNTKNDLALAHILNTPDRCLGHKAFTDLKHAACKSTTSLFLAATSFIRAIELGGKGYAPPESDPLRKHLKGLSLFVHFMDQLEDILGETPAPEEKKWIWTACCGCRLLDVVQIREAVQLIKTSAAAERMVSSIRAVLLKGLSNTRSSVHYCRRHGERTQGRIHGSTPITVNPHVAKGSVQPGSTFQVLWFTGVLQYHHFKRNLRLFYRSCSVKENHPRTYAINHATAYVGRETIKILIAVLDEEALAPPCRNKAQLLTDDQNVLNEAEPGCLLTLYTSPEVPTGLSPKPLLNRINSQQEQAKTKVKERGVRSQFACTYMEDGLPLNRVLKFPNTCQLPTRIHPTRIQTLPSAVNVSTEDESDPTDKREKQVEVGQQVAIQTCRGSGTKPSLKQRDTNDPIRTGVSRKGVAELQTITKTSKRKLSNRECVEQGGDENQPPQKRPPAKVCSSRPGKKSGNMGRKKLIAGQGKLTSFFRL